MNLRLITRILTTVVIATTGAIVAPGAASAEAKCNNSGTPNLQIYTDRNKGGSYCNITEEIVNLKDIGFNDTVSSFQTNGTRWCLYPESGFRGEGAIRTDANEYTADLKKNYEGKYNDRISSVGLLNKDGNCPFDTITE